MAKDKKGVSKIAKAIERSPGAISVMATRRGVPFSVVQQDRRTADPETGQGASRLIRAVSKAAQSEQALNKRTARLGRPFAFH
jgi:hypothetical protein